VLETKVHTHTKQQKKIIFSYILIFKFLERRGEDRRHGTEW
jgi:hypothetical protein